MTQEQVFKDIVEILKPFVRAPDALADCSMTTSILDDLKINSARFVDVVLGLEDRFDIEVKDQDADRVRTVGDAVELVLASSAEK